ncbi:RDD family protein [Pyxidicoccus sp. MSG2]|uniref:RDD family protein n=1 Tax=Pyxidicoccus sp. MSG2 TaxID=2996790 RepID=UPI00226E20F7|nr:RDD family protein [Pyxidicoccus sp. MSG2]MCY1022675.1 RDD family protein [Pyxidicoccus sp. MSG2]
MSTDRERVFMTDSRGGSRVLRIVAADAEETGSPYPKASLFLRLGARVVDVAVAWGLYVVCGAAGAVVALLFLLLADGMIQGQSVGKRIFGVKVMHLPTRSAARHRDSTLRNAPLALVVLLGMMPAPLGWVAGLAGLVVIGGVEAWRVVRDPLGWRLGDTWAQTQVVDGKVVAGATVAARTPVAHQRAPGRIMSAAKVRRGRSLKKRKGQPCASR